MAGLQHLFVAGIRAERGVEAAIGGGRFQRLHLDQADRDWCGPWSLIQAAMLLRGWRRRQVADPNTTREPWRTFWRHVKADCDEGTNEADLVNLARVLSLNVAVTKTNNARRIGSIVATAIENGDIPLIRTTTAQWSHWATACGLAIAPDGTPNALLLLDTSLAAPWAVPYNARQELLASGPAKTKCRYEGHSLDGSRWRARFNSVVVVRRCVPVGGQS